MKTTIDAPHSSSEKTEAPSKLTRTKDITLFLVKYGGRELIDRLGLGHFLPSNGHEHALTAKADQLTDDLERLGPTFVKLGQILSTRSDLLPDEVMRQLSRLEDKVEPLPLDVVEKTIETELGAKISKLFLEFDPVPLGSASLGQVHRAVLRSGQPVAVKVQRPGIRPLIQQDMEILLEFAHWFDKKTQLGRQFRFTEIHSEFEKALLQELDYEAEAQNLHRLKKNLSRFPRIIVPSPVPDYCTKQVLTMDYVEGKKVTKLGPVERLEIEGDKLADSLVHAYLKQVFVDGFFHADPHPGNVFLVDKDHIALLDLGLVGHFSPLLRKKLLQLLPAIYKQDPDEIAEIALEIGEGSENVNKVELSRAYGDVIEKSEATNLEQLGISDTLYGIMRASAKAGLHLPQELSMLGRTLLHLDRIGRVMAPDFNPNASIERHVDGIIQQQMLKDASPRTLLKAAIEAKDFLEQLPRRANRLIESLLDRKLGFRIDLVPEAHLLENLQKIANRITLGLILAALIIGASQLMQVETRFKIFGYPGLAMIFFTLAIIGALALSLSIIRSDRKTREEIPPKV